MGPSRLVATAAALLSWACAVDPGAELGEGRRALDQGAPDRAAKRFERALAVLAPEDPARVDAELGLLAARCFGDPRTTAQEFLEFARRSPEHVREEEFIDMSTWFLSAHRWNDALEVADSARQRFDSTNGRLERHASLVREEWRKNRATAGKLEVLCVYGAPDQEPP